MGSAGQTGGVHEDGWARVLGRYAERVHAIVGDGHHVASPLGAWILVALSSPVAVGAARGELAEALGADPAAAAEFAARLVVHPHPVVGCGAAVWNRPGFDTERISAWRDALPGAVETGDIPTQALLDGWAERHTLGLISRFPIEVTLEVVLLMATALATKVSWARPFDLAPGTALGPSSPWSSRLERVLHAPTGDPRHRQFIADTSRAGTVAVHLAEARGGLLVASVIAAPGVAAVDVLRSAHEIAASEAIRPGSVQRRSLFELPLARARCGTSPRTKDRPPPRAAARSVAKPCCRPGRRHRCTTSTTKRSASPPPRSPSRRPSSSTTTGTRPAKPQSLATAPSASKRPR